MNTKKCNQKIFCGMIAILLVLMALLPRIVKAIQLTDAQWNDPLVAPSWDNSGKNENSWVNDPKAKAGLVDATGLAFNWTAYNKVVAGHNYPFNAAAHLTARSGYVKDDYKMFDNRYIYCVASHVQNYRLNPGTQAFFEKKHTTEKIFEEANHGPDPEFNFLMLAIACYYPGENCDAESSANVPYNLVNQVIAWLCTDEGRTGFSGDWNTDYAYFKSSNVYASLTDSFPKSVAPEIYNKLHAAPPANSGAAQEGITQNMDAWFYDVWHAAYFTRKLYKDWDKQISSYNTAMVEENGEYHVYMDLFTTKEAKIYLDGITFKGHGDWTLVGTETDGKVHFKSPSGETDENGSIGYLEWDESKIGALMPVDMTKAKLFTFIFYNDKVGSENVFKLGNSQTYFSSIIEKGLNLYITIGNDQNPDGNVDVKRYEHEEQFSAAYNVNLKKLDSETGKPLEGAHFDILESFDDSQLDETSLDLEEASGYQSHLGNLIPTEWAVDDIESNYDGDLGLSDSSANLYNWANDDGTQFERWDDPHDDPCDRDDNITDADGILREINSDGSASSVEAHIDIRRYQYNKGYCGGHPAPEIEYIECDHDEEEECDCEEKNQEIHDEEWKAWYAEVEKCEGLAEAGGFFHAIEPGVAQAAMEEDRDQFYKDFISLTYDYSAEEISASKGYIIHGTHTDDIPIETRTITSSEYKDTDMATNIDHTGGGNSDDSEELSIYEYNTKQNKDKNVNNSEAIATSSNATYVKSIHTASSTSSEDTFVFETEDENTEDLETEPNDLIDENVEEATPSNAKKVDKHEITSTGYKKNVSNNYKISTLAESQLRDSISFEKSQASVIAKPDDSIVDWTFIVYNHRTEGEIHFNKQDLNLKNKDNNDYSAYAQANGDGILEGAVYGLFAASDITHPDGHTGVVFKKDNLVSIAITDRNGNGSFMSITEKPGVIYDYESGKIIETEDGWSEQAPKNLHINEAASADKEDDIEAFIGHNDDGSEISAGNGNDLIDTNTGDGTYNPEYFNKYSSNQGYKDTQTTKTTGYFPISNNEDNNGNCWIGRPLIVSKDGSSYYIKELARSEGYELSVYGKNETLITNKEAFEAGGGSFTTGTAISSEIKMDKTNGGNTYSILSNDIQNGYSVQAMNVPENATFNITKSEYVLDNNVTHKEEIQKEVPIYADLGEPVIIGGHTWKAKIGDVIEYNGKKYDVNNIYTVETKAQQVKPSNSSKIINPNLDPSKIIPSENIMGDVNKLFSKSGFRKVSSGAPWALIKVDKYDLNTITEAINNEIFTNTWFSVFNSMQMLGSYYDGGNVYIAVAYEYKDVKANDSLFNEATGDIYVKTSIVFKSPSGSDMDGFVYRTYNVNDCSDVSKNESGFVTSAIVPNEIAEGKPEYIKENLNASITFKQREDETYWAYADGEQKYDLYGNLATKTESEYIDVSPTLVEKVTNEILEIDSYTETGDGIGTYIYTIPQETLNQLADKTILFRITFDNVDVNINGTIQNAQQYVYDHSIIGITLPFGTADSYIESITLFYPGSDVVISDGNTNNEPIKVLERPIRQKVKVVKDIQTNDDGSYAHDTYSENHSDNSIDALGRYNQASTDWLTNLKNGEVENNSTSKIPEFRFKAYLKSNLERLYRDENGTIVWLDRNGNALVPEYQDTDGDGNYETFVWKSGEHTTDFPEVDKMDGNKLISANVQKLYTKVEHNLNSTTTGDISNNVWASYADPQTGDSKNVGELRADNTSQDGTNGEAVKTNGALYSYNGKNTNVAESDRINPNANTGYTRLLETRVETVEDGTGSRDVEQYNYEKFFDAIAAANTDKWDNDMFASKKNYPGQHWFETFEEKYQKDDADPDGTIANTDGVDADGTAGGDRDTSFKPFQWIREKIFGTTQNAKDDYPATHDNDNLENVINTSAIAHSNAEASDAVRQFAITWYLDDEVAKLVRNNGYDEDVAIKGSESYQEEVYDLALEQALIKTYNYLKPFYECDLDTIYSVMWDSAENGGTDQDVTTLSADTLYEKQGAAGEQGQSKDGYYYGVSAYLPYGTYVLVEQQPYNAGLDDFDNKHYKIDKPKELILPSVYEENGNVGAPEVFNQYYEYKSTDTPVDLAKKYMIRFNEEWANNHTDDLRNYVIRAHNFDGDYEIYKYGLDADKLISEITYNNTAYNYDGFSITQELNDPLKDYYNNPLVDTVHDGGNANSHYFADDKNKGVQTANGSTYAEDAIEKRYHYGSISEHSGEASDVLYQHGPDKDDNNPSGFYFKDNVKTMTGNQTAYDEKYASMLVPWSVVEPAESDVYDIANFAGYADSKFRNTFYTSKLRIEKLDSETGEQILHDDAIFAIYAAARDDSKDGDGEVLFYEVDTAITGSKEFLEAMGASDIQTLRKGVGELYSGIVKAGTPICYEEDQIFMTDAEGNRTGTFQVFATNKDGQVVSEDKDEKEYANQNVGYLVTPQPLGAGVYVLVEINPPTGYSRTSPVAIEIYSDKVSYYMNGDKNNKVIATIYENNLFK